MNIKFPNYIYNATEANKYIIYNGLRILYTLFIFISTILKQTFKLTKKLKIIFFYLYHLKITLRILNFFVIIRNYDLNYKSDIIIAYRLDLSALIAFLLKKFNKRKMFIVCNGMEIFDKKFEKKIYLKMADGIIVRSNYIKNILIKLYKINKDKIFICADGFDQKEFVIDSSKEELRKELNISKDDFCLLSVGALYPPRKGFDLVIKSIYNLKMKYKINVKNLKYFIIGRDNLKIREYLIKLAEKFNLK
ncbi:MAG: glycosyltransferase, partial [Candidatus Helarchaeota archaeon]